MVAITSHVPCLFTSVVLAKHDKMLTTIILQVMFGFQAFITAIRGNILDNDLLTLISALRPVHLLTVTKITQTTFSSESLIRKKN